MTGQPYKKTRVILSDRFFSPSSGRPDFDESAIAFKQAITRSVESPRLDPDIAVKALPSTIGNTDGKKRTNTGEIPGVVDINGIRFKPGEKGGDGKVFKWIPGLHSRENPTKKQPNFGWIDVSQPLSPAKKKPEIRVHKYRVSPKNGEPIDGSEERINPYNLASGEVMEKELQFKKLPGRTIGQIVPGGNLLARSAAKLGIWVDEFNKLRCPPGTPAANQFTDATGSNCFGFSPSRLYEMAQSVMNESRESSTEEMLNRLAASEPEGRSGLSSGRVSNTTWWRNHFGARQLKKEQERIRKQGGPRSNEEADIIQGRLETDPSKLSVVETPSQFRWFISGAKRAATGYEASKRRVSKLQDNLGVTATDDERSVNLDLVATFEELSNRGLLGTTLGNGPVGSNRPTYEQVIAEVTNRLESLSPEAWSRLSDNQKEELIKNDVKRWYEVEREMLEAILDSYVQMREHMRNVKWITYGKEREGHIDEASTYSEGGDSWEESGIRIDIAQIMTNEDSMLPSLDKYNRLRIDAIGGSDSENAQAMSDFLVSAHIEAKRTAALALGKKGFARHIMYHEIGHTIQIAAVGRKLRSLIESGQTSNKQLSDFTNQEIYTMIDKILKEEADFIESMSNAITKTDAVKFLAGTYPLQYEGPLATAEAGAELFALRMSGLIWGDDIDDALAWMDDVADGRFAEDRIGYAQLEQSVFDSAGNTPFTPSGMSPVYRMSLDDARRRKIENQKQKIRDVYRQSEMMSESELVDEIINAEAEAINARNIANNTPDGSRSKRLNEQEAQYYEAIHEEYSRAGRKKFGNTASGRQKLNDELRARKEAMGMLSDDEQSALNEERRVAQERADEAMRAAQEKQSLEEIADRAKSMENEELIDNLVLAERDAKDARSIANSEMPDSEEKQEWEKEASRLEKISKIYKDAARERYGSSAEGKKKLEKDKFNSREKRNLLTQEEADKLSEQKRKKQIEDNAKNDSEATLIQRLADIEAELNSPETDENRKDKLNAEKRAYRREIKDRRKSASGGTAQRNTDKFIDNQVRKNLEESGRIEKSRRQKPKRLSGKRNAEEHALSERSSLMLKATHQERDAITQMADPSIVDIGNLLDPKNQVRAAKAINKRNRRATKGGNDVDESSRMHGSLAGQVENILIPSLELIDKSELSETVEIEAVVELSDLQISGADDALEIDSPSLLSGRLLTDRSPFDAAETIGNPTEGGKKPTRIIVRAEKGQKGYFPHWSDVSSTKDADYEQKLVLPPGKLKIAERRIDKNGNEIIIAEIVKQNDPVESLSSMMNLIGEEGPEPTQHAKGTTKKLERVVNSHLATRRRQGKTKSPETPPKTAEKISERNNQVRSEITEAGGNGPGGMSDSEASRISTEIDNSLDEAFGPVQSKEERKIEREAKQVDIISRFRELIEFGGSDEEIGIDESDITPEVREMLMNMSDSELMKIIKEESRNFHQSLDKRPRVRVSNEEVESLADGKIKRISSPEAMEDEQDSISLAERVKKGFNALNTPEMVAMLNNVSKAAARKLAEDELRYLVEDGTISEETAQKLSEALEELIPASEAQFDPVLVVNAVKSVIEKQKAKGSKEGLSQKEMGSLVSDFGDAGQGESSMIDISQKIVNIALILSGSKHKDVDEWGKEEISSLSAEASSRRARRRASQESANTNVEIKESQDTTKNYGGYEIVEPDNPEPEPGDYPDDVVTAAREHRDEIVKVEKEMTETLVDLANKHKGKMEGLAFRLKSLKSLARKIAAEKDEEHGGDAKKAAESMSDVVRYTMSYQPEDYVDGVTEVVKELTEQGYKLRIKNYWEGGDPYQGINIAAEHPDGVKFELQFHTPQSVVDKEEIHKLYESYRTETDVKKRYKLYDSMVRMAQKIQVPYPPEKLMEIGTLKYQPFTVKLVNDIIERKILVDSSFEAG